MLRQQHFMHQRKNLHIPILGRIFSGELISEDNYRFSPSEFFQYRTGLYLGQRRRRRIRGDMTARSATRSPPIKTKESLEIQKLPVGKTLQEFIETLRGFSFCVMD